MTFAMTNQEATPFVVQAVCGIFMAFARVNKEHSPHLPINAILKSTYMPESLQALAFYFNNIYHSYYQRNDAYVVTTINHLLSCGYFKSTTCLFSYLLVRCQMILKTSHEVLVSDANQIKEENVDKLRVLLGKIIEKEDATATRKLTATFPPNSCCAGEHPSNSNYDPTVDFVSIQLKPIESKK
jgi:hypothetical protein